MRRRGPAGIAAGAEAPPAIHGRRFRIGILQERIDFMFDSYFGPTPQKQNLWLTWGYLTSLGGGGSAYLVIFIFGGVWPQSRSQCQCHFTKSKPMPMSLHKVEATVV
jgi:hypothetical protein